MKRYVIPWMLLVLLAAAIQPVGADVLPGKYRLEPFATSLAAPEGAALAPDGRIFVLEKNTGNVRIIKDGLLLASPLVTVPVPTSASSTEAGLLGIALHPDFSSNGWLYLYYTHDLGTGSNTNRIVRYNAKGDTATDLTVILDNIGYGPTGLDNGGALAFGSDGKLYAGVGVMEDDSSAASFSSLGGKILRMNDDGSTPGDNPNTELDPPYELIWANGFRNPAAMAFNDAVGTLYISDNYDGDSSCDEINVGVGDTDYGWTPLACGTQGLPPSPMHAMNPQITAWGVAPDTGGMYAGSCSNDVTKDCVGDVECKSCSHAALGCATDTDCWFCSNDAGRACLVDTDCGTCDLFPSVDCTSNAECGICATDPPHTFCTSDADCMLCDRTLNRCQTDDDCYGGGNKCQRADTCLTDTCNTGVCDENTCDGACNNAANNLFIAGRNSGSTCIVRDALTGASFDQTASSGNFYVPSGSCPTAVTSLAQGDDGWIYATAAGTGAGLYRLIYDDYGSTEAAPRETAATPHAPLTLTKDGAGIKFRWEDLKKEAWGRTSGRHYCSGAVDPLQVLKYCVDSSDCGGDPCLARSDPTGSKNTKYTLWSGPFTSPFTYGHSALVETSGTDDGDALVTHTESSVPSADQYYLVSARGANYEGTTGYGYAGERAGHTTTNLCDDIGYGDAYSDYEKCVGDMPTTYADQNNEMRNFSDFRGRTVLLSMMQYG